MNLPVPPTPPPAENAASPDIANDAADLRAGNPDWLPCAHRLNEFEIVRVLGAGGFGIVYLALDQTLLRYVAIKEYFPVSLAMRRKNAHVEVRSRESANSFDLGLESFINEARLLASFDHPSLVKVHRFWKQNGTAYMVMQYYPGQTLKDVRRAMTQPPDEAWLRAFMEPVLGALELLHAQDIFHRDIAPDNILLLPDGQPVVLDFGSARRVIGDSTQSLTAVLKPNFSPVEQYADDAGMRQGAYTDLFALGGTVRFMLTGDAPTPAVMRAVRDTLPALSRCEPGRFPGVSSTFLATIDWTLALAPSDRPQHVAMVRDALRGALVPPEPSARLLASDDAVETFGRTAALAKTQVLPRAAGAATDALRTVSLHRDARAPSSGEVDRPAFNAWGRHTKLMASVLFAVAAITFVWLTTRGASADANAATAEHVIEPITPPVVDRQPDASVPLQQVASTPAVDRPAASAPANVIRPTAATRQPVAKPDHPAEPLPRRHAAEPTQAPATATTTPSATTGSSPLDACNSLGVFAKAMCIKRACDDPALKSAPRCLESRRLDEQRQRRMDQ